MDHESMIRMQHGYTRMRMNTHHAVQFQNFHTDACVSQCVCVCHAPAH